LKFIYGKYFLFVFIVVAADSLVDIEPVGCKKSLNDSIEIGGSYDEKNSSNCDNSIGNLSQNMK
jgi:hypothetical protein